MRTWALISHGELLRTTKQETTPIDGDWRPIKESKPPAFNPETEDLVEVAPLIDSDGVTRRWEVVTLAERRPGRGEAFSTPVPNDNSYVPPRVSLRQFRMALRRAGMFEAVDALRTSQLLTPQQRTDVEDYLEYSNEIERIHPMILGLAPLVGVTSEQIDDLFRAASAL